MSHTKDVKSPSTENDTCTEAETGAVWRRLGCFCSVTVLFLSVFWHEFEHFVHFLSMKKMKGVCLCFFIYVFILKLMFRMKSKKQTTAKALFHLGVAAVTLRHQRAATTGRWIFPATTHAVFY